MQNITVELSEDGWNLLMVTALAQSRSLMDIDPETSHKILDLVISAFSQVQTEKVFAKG